VVEQLDDHAVEVTDVLRAERRLIQILARLSSAAWSIRRGGLPLLPEQRPGAQEVAAAAPDPAARRRE
jgi:hypothetical protein